MEVLEVFDNERMRCIFRLVWNPKTQDYTAITEDGIVMKSVSVYRVPEGVWPNQSERTV